MVPKQQVERIVWTEFARKHAIVLAVLYQTNSMKLKNKILAAAETDCTKTIHMGLALEQSSKRADIMTKKDKVKDKHGDRVAKLEEEIMYLR